MKWNEAKEDPPEMYILEWHIKTKQPTELVCKSNLLYCEYWEENIYQVTAEHS